MIRKFEQEAIVNRELLKEMKEEVSNGLYEQT